MKWLEISNAKPIRGNVVIPGSKNSSLAILSACCLCDEKVILRNVPNISDIEVVYEIGKDIGMYINKHKNEVEVDCTNLHSASIEPKKSSLFRASYYFVGALLSKFKEVSIGYPGGDDFGSRPIDQHIKGLEALGAKFTFYNDYYVVRAEKLKGANIYFDVITSGATMNVLLAATRAEGKTVLYNAARDPEVVDLAVFLNEMGANIKGAGTHTIEIEGVQSLHKCTHTIMPDRLIAAAFLMAAGIKDSRITVQNVIPEHLESCITKLKEAGININEALNSVTAYANSSLNGIKVEALMYPGFATDYQQPLTAILTAANSHSIIADRVYPGRINHCVQLNRMGAGIIMRDECIVVPGNRALKGAWVHATDVRAGISLILAGLLAKDKTYITGVEHIERGYEDIVKDFSSLGVDIKMKTGDLRKEEIEELSSLK